MLDRRLPRERTRKSGISIALLWLAIALPEQAQGSGNKSPYMQQGKKFTITINSNVTQATVMEEGLFVGHTGAAFDSAIGVHELIVAAPGHVPRLIRVNLAAASLTYQVNLAPDGDKDTDVEIDYTQAKAFKTSMAAQSIKSLCASYNGIPNGPLSRDLILPCARATLIDDFEFLGRSWLPGPVTRVDDDASYWRAEESYAAAPGDPAAATALAYSAAMRQDCSRVLEVSMENSTYKSNVAGAPGLVFLRGLCFEMAGMPDKAARLYLHLGSRSQPPADVLYHLARVQAPVAPDSAVKTLRVCTKAYESYYPCYEAAAQVQAIAGKRKEAEATMRVYHKRTRDVLAKVFASGGLNEALIRPALASRPFSFELNAAAALLVRKTGAPLPAIPVENTLISDPSIVRQLLPHLEESVAADALLPIYVLLARQFPNDPSSWIRLASAYRIGDRCSEAIKASERALSMIQDERRRASLLVSSTDCLVRLERLTDAESILQQVIDSGAGSWKAYYNLGVVQERLEKTAQAIRSYELAMADDMPQTLRARLEAKLEHYRALAEEADKKTKKKVPSTSH